MRIKKQSSLLHLRRCAQINKFAFDFHFFLIVIMRFDLATLRQENQRSDRLREKNFR